MQINIETYIYLVKHGIIKKTKNIFAADKNKSHLFKTKKI